MSNQHTKGPWLINQDAERHEPGFYGVPHQPGQEEVYTSIMVGTSARLAAFIRPADARLISAAPDLLVAIRKALAVWHNYRIDSTEIERAVEQECSAAIDKAESRS